MERYSGLSDEQLQIIDAFCVRFEDGLLNERPLDIETELGRVPAAVRGPLFVELLALEVEWRSKRQDRPRSEEYCVRFPIHREAIEQTFREVFDSDEQQRPARPARGLGTVDDPTEIVGVTSDTSPESADLPERIGRYRVETMLGSGGFGVVYLARDEELDRRVAVKVPHPDLISGVDSAAAYLAEARSVASLDHPNIVPAYDVGGNDRYPCYLVSKFIEGTTLAARLKQEPLAPQVAAELVAQIALALQDAHSQGMVHRDVKPGNILIDRGGTPYLSDFGLALREETIGQGPHYVGTPPYMSPEQARGEGHRVDGRSDIFSLGVVLYEALTGRRPFRGADSVETLQRVTNHDPRPLRQYDPTIPTALERVCLKALSKKASRRYPTAFDLSQDLQHYLGTERSSPQSPSGQLPNPTSSDTSPSPVGSDAVGSSVALSGFSRAIVPRGLQSFDERDSDFFVELLPGPRDRDGLPDCLGFWKAAIEGNRDDPFAIGLLYGPSGCGKTSLIKAGLLPRLSSAVDVVYVGATADTTEQRLLRGLQKQSGGDNQDLPQVLMKIRQRASGADGKLLIVIDQFEQWLQSRYRPGQPSDLVAALRQCDGVHVQCIILVRDDFWLATSRFLSDLEVDLVPGKNVSLCDLFDTDHSQKVLAAFGQAFGKLPPNLREASRDQREFLRRAVDGLADDGRLVCVRLALFAEMMKSRVWVPSTLRVVGGMHGLGVRFLEDTFESRFANPRHRAHERAARAVLNALLPESGSNIKGQMWGYHELLRVSGYDRSSEFDELIRILDQEVRLITPTEPLGPTLQTEPADHRGDRDETDGVDELDEESPPGSDATGPEPHYQLTHDYLVHPLRDWLTAGQRKTRRGRAALQLAERGTLWTAKPENRNLPSWLEYLNIQFWTERKAWSDSQREMMRRASLVQGLRVACFLAICVMLGTVGQQTISALRYQHLLETTRAAVTAMGNTRTNQVPHAIRDLARLPRHLVAEELERQFSADDERGKLPLAYARAAFGIVDIPFLVQQIPAAGADEVHNLVTALNRTPDEALQGLGRAAEAATLEEDWRAKQRLAIVMMHMGDVSVAADMCQLRADPVQRSVFIDRMPSWHGDLQMLARHETLLAEPALRSAVCLGMGGVGRDRWSNQEMREVRDAWSETLNRWYQDDDSGVHSAVGWLCRQWQLPAPEARAQPGSKWVVNSAGITMIRVPAGKMTRFEQRQHGGGDVELVPQQVNVTRPFLLGDREVTVGQFQLFVEDQDYPAEEKPQLWTGPLKHISPSPGHPVQHVSWIDCVLFCNWLSWREEFSPAYERTGRVRTIPSGEFEEWRPVPGSNGYRLPTEAEWEYGCRSATTTAFVSGDDDHLMVRYSVMGVTRAEVCGSKLPNGWGFFDVHGNVYEWCQDWHAHRYLPEVTDPMGPESNARLARVLRSGSFGNGARAMNSHFRTSSAETARGGSHGLRVARTLTE